MSDVNIAPAPDTAQPSAPPSRTEVPIEQNPVSSPSPLGSQAPARQGGEESSDKRPSRREAIQRAFQKAEDAGRPGPAKARMGHNQPPEETPQQKLDLRQPPPKEPQHREGGRFARAPEKAADDPSRQAAPGQPQPGQPHQQARQLPETAPYRAPPPRFSDHAKATWADTPEPVRGDIYRMHQEVDKMHHHYRQDKAVVDSIREYHNLASQQGTTLQRALHNYVNMEAKLRQDVIGGLDIIVQNMNLRTPDGRKLGLRDVAWHILNTDPSQHKAMQSEHTQSALSTQIGQLHQIVQGLAHNQHQMQYERQFVRTRGAVDQFADTHPRFDELGAVIEQELRAGYDLETAYRRADRLYPATHAAQTRTTSAQTRPDRSISGAPSGGSSNERTRGGNGKAPGRREAIRSAIRSVNGGM